jgi:TolB-like protein/Tfp pilus assembly protein PilF
MGHSNSRIRFANYEADLRSGELFSNGLKIPLQEKPFQILTLLLRRAPKPVTRDEIFARVWSDTYVERRLSLNTAMRKLRVAFREGARTPRIIETTPEGYRLLVKVQPVSRGAVPAHGPAIRLAVAPFQNLGGEAQDYFADGLTEQMIVQLGHTQKQFSIIAPFSTLRYKGSGKSAVEIGRELKADYVLEGSVSLRARVVKVRATLVHTSDAMVIWSDSFSRDHGDIFAIQDAVTNRITDAILRVLSAPEARALSTTPAAYEKFLRGCFFANKWSAEGFRKAVDNLQQAIAADPGFAPAHASLAKLYMGMSAQGILPPEVINKLTLTAASEALRLCPDLADAHIALGWASIFYDGNPRASEQSFLRAIELNPSSNTAYEGYGHLLTACGRHQEAIEVGARACALDPLSPFAANALACDYYFARQYNNALAQCQRNLEMDAEFGIGYSCLGWICGAMAEHDKAVEALRKAVAYNPASPAMKAGLAAALGHAGKVEESRSVLREVLAARESVWIPPYWIALAYLGLRDYGAALDWLARGVEERDGWRVFYGVDPKLDLLRSNSSFQTILRRVGLPLRGPTAGSSRGSIREARRANNSTRSGAIEP